MFKIVIALLLGFSSGILIAQNTSKPYTSKIVTFADNVNAPLTPTELAQITEAFGDYTAQYVLDNPRILRNIKNILRNRVVVKEVTNPKERKDCDNLSTVPLFDSFVSDIRRDDYFNPNTFNPLKYNFDFYSMSSYMYKVDNTNYYIMIKSQFL